MNNKLVNYYNKQYIRYACIEDNTEQNFLKSLKYRERYGQLTNNREVLEEVRQARKAFRDSKRAIKTVILLPFSKNQNNIGYSIEY